MFNKKKDIPIGIPVYFSDLNDSAQQFFLNAVGISSPSEKNWDGEFSPIAVVQTDLAAQDRARKMPRKPRMSRDRAMRLLIAYIANDAAAADTDYVREVLRDVCGMTAEEAEELGIADLYGEDEDE